MILVPATVVPANPNSVHIGMVRAGCLKTKFNPAFPNRLNGIISQSEFRESIDNINSKISSNKSKICCLVFFVLCLVGGLALVIAYATASRSLSGSASIVLIAIGIGAIAFAPLFFTIGCCVIRRRRTMKMRHAIVEESKKYSTRSPISCSWRLNVTTVYTGGYRHHNRYMFLYHVIINIRHPVASGGSARLHPNQVAPRPSAPFRPQNDIPPPPYPGPPAGFCSQCGVPKPDLTAKFCASCGYSFQKY